MDEIEAYITGEAQTFPGKTAVYYSDIENDGSMFSMHADEKVVSASMIKVPVMMSLLEKARDGRINLCDMVTVREDQILDDSLVFEYGSRPASVYELMVWMIVNSDNTATNVLFDMLGYDYMNDFFCRIGLKSTSVGRNMLDYDAISKGYNNYISPMDFYRCMRYLYDNRKEKYNAAALNVLARNRDHGSLCRYLYDDMTVMHKTGGLDDIAHDGGIFVTGRGTYFLGIFVSEFAPEPEMEREAEKMIGRISRKIYEERAVACRNI